MATDAQWAAQGRALAEALGDHAYTRKDEDRKRVLMLHTEICKMARDEREAASGEAN